MRKKVKIYTDGACSGNPGPGGYGAVLLFGAHRKELSGFEPDTTNNRMEIFACIAALECLREPCDVELYSDSQYVVNAMSRGWAESWKSRGWKRSGNEPALNPDLWDRLLSLCKTHNVTFNWVKGHADNELNNRCDELATGAIKNRGDV